MSTVYIWRNQVQTAHASLLVSPSRKADEYLSYHPTVTSGKDGVWGFVEVLAASVVNHFIPPKKSSFDTDLGKYRLAGEVELSRLDEDSMAKFIDELFDSKNHHEYNLFFQNCSTTVGMCLIKGFSKLSHDFNFYQHLRYDFAAYGLGRVFSHYGDSANSILAKLMFEDLPRQFMFTGGNPELRKIAMMMQLALKGFHGIVWDPDDVFRLARYIQNFEEKYLTA